MKHDVKSDIKGETYVDGATVAEELREGLMTEDARVVYPVEDDIPILLEEKGIGTTQLQEF